MDGRERNNLRLGARSKRAVPDVGGAAEEPLEHVRLGGDRTRDRLVDSGEIEVVEMVRERAVSDGPEVALGLAAHTGHRPGGDLVGEIVAMDVNNHIARKLVRFAQATAS